MSEKTNNQASDARKPFAPTLHATLTSLGFLYDQDRDEDYYYHVVSQELFVLEDGTVRVVTKG